MNPKPISRQINPNGINHNGKRGFTASEVDAIMLSLDPLLWFNPGDFSIHDHAVELQRYMCWAAFHCSVGHIKT